MTDPTPPAAAPAEPLPFGTSPYDQGPYSAPQPPHQAPEVNPAAAPLGAAAANQGLDAATTSPFGSWAPFDQYATQPVTSSTPGQGAAPEGSGRSRTGRTVALVAVTALLAGAVGGGVGAAVARNTNQTALPASLTTTSTTAPAAVNLPAGSVEAVAAKVLPSVVSIIERSTDGSGGEGSGIVLSSDGLILTNNHVVTGSTNGGSLRVTTQDGKSVDAKIIGTDPTSDLAVIKASGVSGLTPATLGSSAQLVVGQTVVAVGSPLGLSGTVTSGIVSALNRPVTTSDSSGAAGQATTSGAVLNAIQTDAAINPGNSGGPLVDLNGRVVGINSAIASLGASLGSSQSGSIGLGFSIPIDQARRIATELINTGHATHPQLGVSLTDAANGGAVLASVTPGGPAANAGLQVGDVITAVNGRPADTSDAVVADIRSASPGASVAITYTRAGQSATVNVKLGEASS